MSSSNSNFIDTYKPDYQINVPPLYEWPPRPLAALRWSGPKLAYAEAGRLLVPDWSFEEICSLQDYAKEIEGWINKHGVQIVGGGCGTGPEHIRALKSLLLDR
jgi:S-methylmethionine-dependent homocysteine/selenocysteine methylase